MPHDTLLAIAQRCGTDKAGLHDYTGFYQDLLEHRRNRPTRLLEIGVGGNADSTTGGHSLRMWKEYFPNSTVVGLDLYDKSRFEEDRIHIAQGDQSDPEVLRQLHHKFGPFDIIIDDGSHVSAHVRSTFSTLFPLLVPDGIYVIEDLQTSYWPSWGGSLFRRSPWTSMGFLKDRIDGLHYPDFRFPKYQPTQFDSDITEIRFRRNIAALIKRANDDPAEPYSPPGWSGVLRRSLGDQVRNSVRGVLRGT